MIFISHRGNIEGPNPEKENMPEYIVQRFKKERRAAMRNAKLRLSKINLAEISQVLRGQSKRIKN